MNIPPTPTILLKSTNFKTLLLFAAIIGINSLILGSRVSEDSDCWLRISNFFLDTNIPITTHCLYNPVGPLLALGLKLTLRLQLENAYLIINYLSLFIASSFFFLLLKKLINPKIALISSVLFLTHYMTINMGFAIQIDSLNWMFISLLLYLAYFIYTQKHPITIKQIIFLSAISTTAILTKTNLGFLLPTFPLIFLLKKDHWFAKSFIYSFLTLTPVFTFYYWGNNLTQSLPWTSFDNGFVEQTPTMIEHAIAFSAPVLYLWPFLFLGLSQFNYKKIIHPILLSSLVGLLIPIIIWPYIMDRFTFTLFPFFLPVTALGISKFAQYFSKHKLTQLFIIATTLVAIYLLHYFRLFLTFQNLTHFQFATKLSSIIF